MRSLTAAVSCSVVLLRLAEIAASNEAAADYQLVSADDYDRIGIQIDWSAASAGSYTISQCESITFVWDTSSTATQQHSIVEFSSQEAYDTCDLSQAVELVPPSPDIEVSYRNEEDVFDCRKDCRSRCCTHDDRTMRFLQKVKTCNTKRERACRDDCFQNKGCGDDQKCKLSCRKECCTDDDDDDEAEDEAVNRNNYRLCNTESELECRDMCYQEERCTAGDEIIINTASDEDESGIFILSGDDTLKPKRRWFGDGVSTNCQSSNRKVEIEMYPDLRNRAKGYMCSEGSIRDIESVGTLTLCREACMSLLDCVGVEYNAITQSCAVYEERPTIGEADVDTVCEIAAKTCGEEPSMMVYVPPTGEPTSKPSYGPTRGPTLPPSMNPSTSSPSDDPTRGPTLPPSLNPTTSSPSDHPTRGPTLPPSLNPTTSSPSAGPSNLATTSSAALDNKAAATGQVLDGCSQTTYPGYECQGGTIATIKVGSSVSYCNYHCSRQKCVAFMFRGDRKRCYLYGELPTSLGDDSDSAVCELVASSCEKDGSTRSEADEAIAVPGTKEPTAAPASAPPSAAPVSTHPTKSPITSHPTLAPATDMPSNVPVAMAPTENPVTSRPTLAPVTSAPSTAPVTAVPTDSPVTEVPTQSPATDTPSGAPVSMVPTNSPITGFPTLTPVTSMPSSAPVSTAPTNSPVIYFPTLAPVTSTPSMAPIAAVPTDSLVTKVPTQSPATDTPSGAPVSMVPTNSPIAGFPTLAPETSMPSSAPVSTAPTNSPVTDFPTLAPVTATPSMAPATVVPSESPITGVPTLAPVTDIPSAAPVSMVPTYTPVTSIPSVSPVTTLPSLTPVSTTPTQGLVTDHPTLAPVTGASSEASGALESRGDDSNAKGNEEVGADEPGGEAASEEQSTDDNGTVDEVSRECVDDDLAGSGCFELGHSCTIGSESCCGRDFKSVVCTCSDTHLQGVETHGFGVWQCLYLYPCRFLEHTC